MDLRGGALVRLMRDPFCLEFGFVSNQLIGGIEDHLAGHINRDGISKKIVNQRMFPRGEEEDKLRDGISTMPSTTIFRLPKNSIITAMIGIMVSTAYLPSTVRTKSVT